MASKLRGRAGGRGVVATVALLCACIGVGCSATDGSQLKGKSSGNGPGSGGSGGLEFGSGGSGASGDPVTCADAEEAATYIGCDFYPTVTPNNVWSVFDYAVVVANGTDQVAEITVDRGGAAVATANVQPNSAGTIYLPWVPALKGPDADSFGTATPFPASILVSGGAYHLVSSVPVTVYQFNALEYAPVGGPPGKDWSTCPSAVPSGCFSYTNDASILLPSTTQRQDYRLTGTPGWQLANMGGYAVVTGLHDGTQVDVNVSPNGQIIGGSGVPAAGPGGTSTFTLNRGDAAVVLGPAAGDISGSLIRGSQPIQVIHGVPCIFIPDGFQACDHIEESVFPAETLGQHYFVTRPNGPGGSVVPHTVRIYGNFNGTALTYAPAPPPGAPTSIDAGQVVVLDQVNVDFEVTGSQAFAVTSFLLAASIVDPTAPANMQRGDPAQSIATAVEQYREKYVFLAPTDYDVNYVHVIMPLDATVNIDGAPIAAAPQPISSNFGVARVQLGPGANGSHVLEASAPVGIQVAGYGQYTSYYYPGGSDLKAIAPPPVQ